MAEVKEAKYINLSFDNWTSIANSNFIAVCGHFVNKNFQLVDRCLVLEQYTATHSAEDMKKVIKGIIQKYGLQGGSGTLPLPPPAGRDDFTEI